MANTFQALNAQLVTPSDTNDLTLSGGAIDSTETGACIYVGTAGNLCVTMLGGQKVILYNIPNGSFLPIQVKKVWATDTSASDILALF